VTVWPAGSNESLTGVSNSSNGVRIGFTEPNGSYRFDVTSPDGYLSSPEGNITVDDRAVAVTITFAQNPPPPPADIWSGGNYTLARGLFATSFLASYHWYNSTTGSVGEVSSINIAAVAEVTGSGQVVALSAAGVDPTYSSAYSPPDGTNVTADFSLPVTNAIGLNDDFRPNGQTPYWSTEDAPGLATGSTTVWGNGNSSLGTAALSVRFQFVNGTSPRFVKFDVSVSGWPWVSPHDSLGLEVESVTEAASQPTYFTYDAASDVFTDWWQSNGTPISGLSFGGSATGSGPPTPAVDLSVSDSGGVFGAIACALLTFAGGGGYANLSYDPWISFGVPAAAPPVPPAAGGASAEYASVLAGVVIGALVGSALVLYARRARRSPIEDGLRPAL
jgi:hypothetical protein